MIMEKTIEYLEALIERIESHLLLVETKRPVLIAISEKGLGFAVSKEDDGPYMKDVLGTIMALSKKEVECKKMFDELLDMLHKNPNVN